MKLQISEVAKKILVQNLPKVGNHFKKVHFLGKEAPTENALKDG